MSKLVPAGWLRTGDILVARRLAVRLVLALTAALPELVVTRSALAQSDPANFAPPGRMIVIDGHQVHLHCIAADAPTVILEEGAGGASLNWAWIQWDVAKTTRVCSYDRPGYAWSDPTDTPRDADTVSRELDPLLKSAGEKGPFIAVGHSLGGAYVRMFAAQQHNSVVGLVLVDATNPSAMGDVGLPPIRKGGVASFIASNKILFQIADHIGSIRVT